MILDNFLGNIHAHFVLQLPETLKFQGVHVDVNFHFLHRYIHPMLLFCPCQALTINAQRCGGKRFEALHLDGLPASGANPIRPFINTFQGHVYINELTLQLPKQGHTPAAVIIIIGHLCVVWIYA